ncbi:hypothetical protein [Thermococcus sp.]|uniref:hypothetical protein n=1 Tax=Thermococcus sp. TaxID=35749 RepID=UPI00260F744D|nr:hypothetical protein [Thermococcus sp.]
MFRDVQEIATLNKSKGGQKRWKNVLANARQPMIKTVAKCQLYVFTGRLKPLNTKKTAPQLLASGLNFKKGTI